MMNLQIETEIINKGFNIAPENVFGFLVVVLLLAIGYMSWQLKKKETIIAGKDKQILESSERMHTSFDVIKDKLVDVKNELEKVDDKHLAKSDRIVDLLKRIIQMVDSDSKKH